MIYFIEREAYIRLCFCCSVAKSCPALCDPMDYSTPVLPVLHCLWEFAQTHIHWGDNASNHLVLCCPLLSSCPQSFPASESFPISRVFVSGAKVLELHLQAPVLPVTIWAWFPLRLTGFISLLSKGLESSRAPQFKSIFFGAQSSLWSYSHHCRSVHHYWKNHSFDYMDLYWKSNVSAF